MISKVKKTSTAVSRWHCIFVLCNSISVADLDKMTNFAYYDDYEIRSTMRREHSAALKYMAAEQRLEPTLLAQYNGLRTLKQRKQVSRESIYSNILPI